MTPNKPCQQTSQKRRSRIYSVPCSCRSGNQDQVQFETKQGQFLISLCLGLPSFTYAVQNALTVFIQLQLGDDNFGRMNTDRHALAIGFFTGYSLDMHDVFKSVDARDFTLATLVGPPNYGYLVIFADWYRADL